MPTQSNKPIIFLAFANVRDDSVPYLRNLPDEQRQIREALEKVRAAGLGEIVLDFNLEILILYGCRDHYQ